MIACGNERPLSTSNSRQLSNMAESLPSVLNDREDFFQIVAEQLGFEHALARVHPIDIAAQRVDLAVVDQIAIRMRAFPTRESVGAETRVDQRERGFHQRIGKIGIKRRYLARRQHAFVDERPAGQARNVEKIAAGETRVTDRIFRPPANDVELALERQVVVHTFAAADEHLPHERLERLGRVAEVHVVGRHLAPAEKFLAPRRR